MTINVNQRITPVEPAAETADTALFLDDALRLKKKMYRHLDLLETLVMPQLTPLPQSAPQLDAAIAQALVSQEQRPGGSVTLETTGESPRISASFTHGTTGGSAGQPQSLEARASLAAGASPERQQPATTSDASRAAPNAAEGRVTAPVANAQPALSARAEQAAVAAPRQKLPRTAEVAAPRQKLPRTAEEGTAQAGSAAQVTLTSSGSAAVATAEDAWFSAQAAPVAPPTEQAESTGGMKLSYQFLRWGGGQVDISAQPNQLLFQPSTEMVRDRLGESLLARPQAQSQAWQMDEQPDRRQPQQHRQNDEDES